MGDVEQPTSADDVPVDAPRVSAGGLFDDTLDERRAAFEEWVRTVRDPADANSEGVRRIECRGASAEYEIARIATGFAVRLRLTYRTGTMAGHSSPWRALPSREDCVEHFLTTARRHFADEFNASEVPDSQQRARHAMQELLAGEGLFGFLEPDPLPRDVPTRGARRMPTR